MSKKPAFAGSYGDSQACLSEAKHLTIIQDRDGDIYEEFVTVPNEQMDLLIRSKANRKLADTDKSLYELVILEG